MTYDMNNDPARFPNQDTAQEIVKSYTFTAFLNKPTVKNKILLLSKSKKPTPKTAEKVRLKSQLSFLLQCQ